ncbi:hypothetical protein HDU79_007988 [Rhizoclosmatium sp. JEL0117]|nr:hypothetical protein HDU79_007988 [Rhizoclosmatium sp. JEL0117]
MTPYTIVAAGEIVHGPLPPACDGSVNLTASAVTTPTVLKPSDLVFSLDDGTSQKLATNAVVTLYQKQMVGSYDAGFADVLVLAMQLNGTLAKSKNTVFVVAYKDGLMSTAQRKVLKEFGVRLVQLAFHKELELTAKETYRECGDCFYKILLTGAFEGVYERVLYLDAGVVGVHELDLGNVFGKADKGKLFFGALEAKDIGVGVLDSSVLLFTPSVMRMERMLTEIGSKDVAGYFGDLGFFNRYFSGTKSPSCTAWTPISVPLKRHKFWPRNIQASNVIDPQAVSLYPQWKHLVDLSINAQFGNSTKQRNLLPIPPTHTEFETTLKAGTFDSRFSILAVMDNKTEPHVYLRQTRNRVHYVDRWPGVVSHNLTREISAKNAVWQKVYSLDAVFRDGGVEWAWLLDGRDSMIMNGEIDLRVLVGGLVNEVPEREIDIIIADDISVDINAGSFFVRNSKWVRETFIPAWKKWEFDAHLLQEQNALSRMIDANTVGVREKTLRLPIQRQRLFNSYSFGPIEGQYIPGDFVLHCPSMGWLGLYQQLEFGKYKEY